MSPESQAALRLAEQCDEAIEQCEFCGLRGHRVKDCALFAGYYAKMSQQSKCRSGLRELLRSLFVLVCGSVAGAIYGRLFR